MKKLFTSAKWKRRSLERSRRQARAAVRRSKGIIGADSSGKSRPVRKSSLSAPKQFSMVNNPGETVAFLNRLRILGVDRRVFVDLTEVAEVTPDAIAGLLAVIHRVRAPGAGIHGNVPTNPTARAMIDSSGFRDYVHNVDPGAPRLGAVKKRQLTGDTFEDRFNQQTANDLVSFVMKKLTNGQGDGPFHHPPSYSILAEAMLNTLNHASRTNRTANSKGERWWASAYCDLQDGRACFTFLDQGVGIFESHKLNALLKVQQALRIMNRADILRKILEGQLPSSTGVAGRGNGLPGIYRHCRDGRIRNLTVIANDAYGNAETGIYKQLSAPFEGTLIYWEVVKL